MSTTEGKASALGLLIVVGAVSLGDAVRPEDCDSARSTAHAEKRFAAVLRRQDIFEKAPFRQCHASTIAETPKGLVAAWFGGTAEGAPDIGIWLSRHDGSDWSTPVQVAAGRGAGAETLPCWNPVLFLPKAGSLLLFYKVGPSPAQWRGMVTRSDDDGRSWSPPQRLPDGLLGPVKNHPLELPDGTILCGSSTENEGWRVYFEWTKDLGKTWEKTAPINDGRTFGLIQPALLRLGGPRFEALLRSNVGHIYAATSDDRGRTWSRPEPLSLPNPNSGLDAVTLRDGRHVLVCNPTSTGRSPLAVFMGVDGRAWTRVLTLEDEPAAEFSYPAVIQSSDGLVHIIYTWKRRRIRHVVVEPGE